jgi:hypothetical protein
MALPREHVLDELATAYIQAIAAAAGSIIAVGGRDYGVDGTLRRILRMDNDRYGQSGFAVDYQLKGTTISAPDNGIIKYDLKVRNYNSIVSRRAWETPFYLFLVCFSPDPATWIVVNTEALILHASAFWWTNGGARSSNMATVRIEIPTANRLTSRAIEDMLMAATRRFVT